MNLYMYVYKYITSIYNSATEHMETYAKHINRFSENQGTHTHHRPFPVPPLAHPPPRPPIPLDAL